MTEELLREAEREAAEAHSNCMLGGYKFCVLGVLFGMPLALKTRRQLPWIVGGAGGTAADFCTSLSTRCCRPHSIIKPPRARGSLAPWRERPRTA